MMKRFFGALALLCALAVCVPAQNTSTSGNISTAGSPCGSSNCVYYQLPANTSWVQVVVSGTWTGTLEIATTGATNGNYSNLNSLSWLALTTENTNGLWTVATAGATFLRVRAVTLTSGTANVVMDSQLLISPMLNPVFAGQFTANQLNVGLYSGTNLALTGSVTAASVGNVIYASGFGMNCGPGAGDNSVALQNALNAATAFTPFAQVVIPRGTGVCPLSHVVWNGAPIVAQNSGISGPSQGGITLSGYPLDDIIELPDPATTVFSQMQRNWDMEYVNLNINSSSVAITNIAVSGSNTIYTGVNPSNSALPAFQVCATTADKIVNGWIIVAGDTVNPAQNNGTFQVVHCSGTTLTLANPNGVAETPSAGAVKVSRTFPHRWPGKWTFLGSTVTTTISNLAITSIVPSGTTTNYYMAVGAIGANNGLIGQSVTITDTANPANAGTFTVISSNAAGLTLSNQQGVSEGNVGSTAAYTYTVLNAPNLNLACGDVGQNVFVAGAGSNLTLNGQVGLATTITSLAGVNCNGVAGPVVLGAPATTDVTNTAFYVTPLNIPLTTNLGIAGLAADSFDGKQTEWISPPGLVGSNNCKMDYVSVSDQNAAAPANNSVGFYFGAAWAPNQCRFKQLLPWIMTYGTVVGMFDRNPTNAGSSPDQTEFEFNEVNASYPWISYAGTQRKLIFNQLFGLAGPQILAAEYGDAFGSSGDVISAPEFEATIPGTGVGFRIDARGETVLSTDLSPKSYTAFLNAPDITCTGYTVYTSIVANSSGITCRNQGTQQLTASVNNGVNNDISNTDSSSVQNNQTQSRPTSPVPTHKPGVVGRISPDLTMLMGDSCYVPNLDDLQFTPDEYNIGNNTPGAVLDPTSPTGEYVTIALTGSFTQTNSFKPFMQTATGAASQQALIGCGQGQYRVPATTLNVIDYIKCPGPNTSFTGMVDAVSPGGTVTQVGTATVSCNPSTYTPVVIPVNLSSFTGSTFRYRWSAGSSTGIFQDGGLFIQVIPPASSPFASVYSGSNGFIAPGWLTPGSAGIRSGTWTITSATSVGVTFGTPMSAAPNSCVVISSTDPTTVGAIWPTALTTAGFTVNIHTSGTISGTFTCTNTNTN